MTPTRNKAKENRLISQILKAERAYRQAQINLAATKEMIKKYAKETKQEAGFSNKKAIVTIFEVGIGNYLVPKLVKTKLTPKEYQDCCRPKKTSIAVKVAIRK